DWSARRFTLPANGAEPTHLVGTNSDREELLIMNEDASHNIYLSNTKAGVQTASSSMVVLPKGMTSYLKLPFKTDVWAVCADSGTPLVSIIEVFERNGGQR